MPSLNVTRSYNDNRPFLESHIDDFLDDLETFINVTQLDDSNITSATIDASTKLVNGSISTAKIANNTVTSVKIAAGAVTTIKIADGVLTSGKFIDSSITAAKVASETITSTQIGSGQATNTKFADGSITRAKRANDDNTLDKQDIGGPTYSNATTSFTSVTSRSITTTGRPVYIQLDWNGNGITTNAANIATNANISYDPVSELRIKRDSTVIALISLEAASAPKGGSDALGISWPISSVWFIDQPSSGTYSYSVEGRVTNTTTTAQVEVNYYTLMLSEIH